MTSEPTPDLGTRLLSPLDHLGVERAHLAGTASNVWAEMLTARPDFAASIIWLTPNTVLGGFDVLRAHSDRIYALLEDPTFEVTSEAFSIGGTAGPESSSDQDDFDFDDDDDVVDDSDQSSSDQDDFDDDDDDSDDDSDQEE